LKGHYFPFSSVEHELGWHGGRAKVFRRLTHPELQAYIRIHFNRQKSPRSGKPARPAAQNFEA
jgi:hypothetical protein